LLGNACNQVKIFSNKPEIISNSQEILSHSRKYSHRTKNTEIKQDIPPVTRKYCKPKGNTILEYGSNQENWHQPETMLTSMKTAINLKKIAINQENRHQLENIMPSTEENAANTKLVPPARKTVNKQEIVLSTRKYYHCHEPGKLILLF
jgi:hypothetical protein